MKIRVINGPNMNMLGIREKEIYGYMTYNDLVSYIENYAKKEGIDISFFQSNIEGELINDIQRCYFEKYDGIIINAAAYTHTSIAILDALKATNIPTVEVHMSNIDEREEFRKKSYISLYCFKTIKGLGKDSYIEGIKEIVKKVIG